MKQVFLHITEGTDSSNTLSEMYWDDINPNGKTVSRVEELEALEWKHSKHSPQESI